jgi:hypothetical protein
LRVTKAKNQLEKSRDFIEKEKKHRNLDEETATVHIKMKYNGTASSVVDIFDLHSNTWKTASLSHPRAYLGATTVGNIVLFAGGFDGISVSSVVDIYNATSNTWNVTNLSNLVNG